MKKTKAFTLVEVIVVMVIIAILAAMLLPSLTKYIDKSKETQYIAEARSIYVAAQTAVSAAYGEYGADFKRFVKNKKTGYYPPKVDEEGNIVHDKSGNVVYDKKDKVYCCNLNNWIFFHTQRNDGTYKKGMESPVVPTPGKATPECVDFAITRQMLILLDSYDPSACKAPGSGLKVKYDSLDYTFKFYDQEVLGYNKLLTPDAYFGKKSKNPCAINVRYDVNGHILGVEYAVEGYDKVIIIINGTVNIEDKVTYSTWN